VFIKRTENVIACVTNNVKYQYLKKELSRFLGNFKKLVV
jgi:hypothetical protein